MKMDGEGFTIPDSVLEWLLEPGDPVVRWWTLRDLLDRPPDDPELEAARAAIPAGEPARTILEAQQPGGAWAPLRHLYSPKHTATHWQLDLLADFGFTAADAPVRRACDLFFAWQRPSGAFGMFKGDGGEEPCATGRTLGQFERFGLGREDGVLRAWTWLKATQRRDGGWHCRHTPLRMRPELLPGDLQGATGMRRPARRTSGGGRAGGGVRAGSPARSPHESLRVTRALGTLHLSRSLV
jgi:hypothetical protein